MILAMSRSKPKGTVPRSTGISRPILQCNRKREFGGLQLRGTSSRRIHRGPSGRATARRLPSIAWIRGLVAIVIQPQSAIAVQLQFDRSSILHGACWRLLTGHFTHWNTDHLFWDVCMFVALGTMIGAPVSWPQWQRLGTLCFRVIDRVRRRAQGFAQGGIAGRDGPGSRLCRAAPLGTGNGLHAIRSLRQGGFHSTSPCERRGSNCRNLSVDHCVRWPAIWHADRATNGPRRTESSRSYLLRPDFDPLKKRFEVMRVSFRDFGHRPPVSRCSDLSAFRLCHASF